MDNFSKNKNTSNFSKTQREAFEKKAKSPSDLLLLLDKETRRETGRETAEFTIEHKALVDHFDLENHSMETIKATEKELVEQKKQLDKEDSDKTQSTKGVEERDR